MLFQPHSNKREILISACIIACQCFQYAIRHRSEEIMKFYHLAPSGTGPHPHWGVKRHYVSINLNNAKQHRCLQANSLSARAT